MGDKPLMHLIVLFILEMVILERTDKEDRQEQKCEREDQPDLASE